MNNKKLDFRKIGEKIRKARGWADMTQKELAEKIGIDPVTLHRIEKGIRSVTAVELKIVSLALERSLSFFYGEEDKEEKITASSVSEDIIDLRDLDSEDRKFIDGLIKRCKKEKK